MEQEKKLSEMVAEKLAAEACIDNSPIFSDEVREALRLSQLYATAKPKEYVLPLNAMAGFKMPS